MKNSGTSARRARELIKELSMKSMEQQSSLFQRWLMRVACLFTKAQLSVARVRELASQRLALSSRGGNERGDVPGWVLVVLMTTGLVTAIWMIAAPRLTAILRNSLDSMNGIR